MNSIQLKYRVLNALEDQLGNATVTTRFGDEIISFDLDNGKQRANVKIEVVDIPFCNVCGKEIDNPRYNQNAHDECVTIQEDKEM